MRQPGSITMQEIQRLVGEQAIAVASLWLYIDELKASLPPQPKADVVDVQPDPNGVEPVGVTVTDG